MTLDKLLSKIVLLGGLSLFSYNCASTSPDSTYCSKDTDCKGDRICDQNTKMCVDGMSQSNYTCDQLCINMYKCDNNSWGAYDTKSNCIKDCELEPWSEKFKYCLSIGCNSKCQ